MLSQGLLYTAAALTAGWGLAHLVPTRSVVAGFGRLSADNTRIIQMEWIVEGVALLFIGVLIASVTYVDSGAVVASVVYRASAGVLFVLALVSLATGFRIAFLPFRLCPFIFTTAAILVLIADAL